MDEIIKMRDKLGRFVKGKHPSIETEFKKGNKGFWLGKKRLNMTGKNHPMYGKHHTEETKEKCKLANLEKHRSPKTEFKKGIVPWNKNKELPQFYGDKHPNWKGGIFPCIDCGTLEKSHYVKRCFECGVRFYKGEHSPNWRGGLYKYPSKFNKTLKDFIRRRDNWKCQKCGAPQEEFINKLPVHHIDYDKNNCNFNNLITLCKLCNTEVNFNREYWTNYFQEKIGGLKWAGQNLK